MATTMFHISTLYAVITALPAAAYAGNLNLPVQTKPMSLPQDGISPRPTSVSLGLYKRSQTVSCFDFNGTMLVAPDETCGYLLGLHESWLTCSTSQICALMISSGHKHGGIACCQDQFCQAGEGCVDSADYWKSSKCAGGNTCQGNPVFCTDKSAPYCVPISFAGGFKDFICSDRLFSTAIIASTTYSGEADGRSFETLSCPTSNPSPTPVGAIVGGVVGGIAAICLIGLSLFFILRNKRRKKKDNKGGKNKAAPPYPSMSDPSNQITPLHLNPNDPLMGQGTLSPGFSNISYPLSGDRQQLKQESGVYNQQSTIYEAASNTVGQHRGQMHELA